MREIFLIRHAKAVDRENWKGDDCDRPLKEKGKIEFRAFAERIKNLFPEKITIVSSPCARAVETAKILSEIIRSDVKTTELLLPDADVDDYLKVLKKFEGDIAIVAHQPDLSIFLNELICVNPSRIKFKKGSIAKVSKKDGRFFLEWFMAPSVVEDIE
ncbi:SixA phosphatase family protein [Desulfurobacterium indicum]|uniref:Phosphohistidine phosphatase n=1 Tax=Desulfurobacterium indicum TaxID=1914305 RepID=A0A1R1MNH0_9BACT|nr:histidine phosphatase family protein [Desulfurobacterium indicum]OMH41372.1 phosphohistidine phosphatase [Desulfurobacterium indicum]